MSASLAIWKGDDAIKKFSFRFIKFEHTVFQPVADFFNTLTQLENGKDWHCGSSYGQASHYEAFLRKSNFYKCPGTFFAERTLFSDVQTQTSF